MNDDTFLYIWMDKLGRAGCEGLEMIYRKHNESYTA